MKKFEFHLQKLLSYKEQLLDGEMMVLAELNNRLKQEEEKLENLINDRQSSRENFKAKMKEKLIPADFNVFNVYEKHMEDTIAICEIEIDAIKNQVEEQTEKVKDLKIETKSLVTIKDARYEEYLKEKLKKEEKFVDEFVAGRRIVEKSFN